MVYPINKYRLVLKKNEATAENIISVKADPRAFRYVAFAARILFEGKHSEVVIQGTGPACHKVIQCVEMLRNRVANLHSVYTISTKEFNDEYHPKEEGLEKIFVTRSVHCISATLTMTNQQTIEKLSGYMPPAEKVFNEEAFKTRVSEHFEKQKEKNQKIAEAIALRKEKKASKQTEGEEEKEETAPQTRYYKKKDKSVARVKQDKFKKTKEEKKPKEEKKLKEEKKPKEDKKPKEEKKPVESKKEDQVQKPKSKAPRKKTKRTEEQVEEKPQKSGKKGSRKETQETPNKNQTSGKSRRDYDDESNSRDYSPRRYDSRRYRPYRYESPRRYDDYYDRPRRHPSRRGRNDDRYRSRSRRDYEDRRYDDYDRRPVRRYRDDSPQRYDAPERHEEGRSYYNKRDDKDWKRARQNYGPNRSDSRGRNWRHASKEDVDEEPKQPAKVGNFRGEKPAPAKEVQRSQPKPEGMKPKFKPRA